MGTLVSAAGETSGRAAILMYHRVSEEAFDPVEGDYVVAPAVFTGQMRWLAARGRVVGVPALAAGPCPDGSVVLTFDDGCVTDFTVVLPLLREAGLPAAFFVNPARIGREGYLTWPQVHALGAAGMVVGSHGLDHRLLDGLADEELTEQLGGSKRALERELGRPVETVSLPGGSGGSRAVSAARAAGYRLVFGSRPGLVRPPALPPELPRYALRRSVGLEEFEALVEQRVVLRTALALRYRITRLARATLGAGRYERLRARSLPARPASAPADEGKA